MKINRSTLLKNADFFSSLVLLAFCGSMWWQIQVIKGEGARVMPYMVLVIAIISSVGLLLSSLKRVNIPVNQLFFGKKELIIITSMVVMLLLVQFIGLMPSIFLMITVVGLVIEDTISKKSIIRILCFNVAFMAVLYIGFVVLLKMYIPMGMLFGD